MLYDIDLTTKKERRNRYALSFDGVDDYVEVPSSSAYNIGTEMTIEMWFRAELNDYSGGAGRRLISRRVDANNGFVITQTNAMSIDAKFVISGVSYIRQISIPTLNTMYHLAVVFDNGTIYIYLNAVEGSIASSNNPGLGSTDDGKLFVGRLNANSGFFNGKIDDIRIWNIARTESEIQSDMNRELIGDEAGLVGYWKFNKDFDGTALSLVDNGNTTADFVGKIKNSTVENPHLMKRTTGSTLSNPTIATEGSDAYQQTLYDGIAVLDGISPGHGTSTSSGIAQLILSFNIIEQLTRDYGVEIFEGAATLADKITWAKANIKLLTCNWWGRGTGPSGNNAYLRIFFGGAWAGSSTHSSGSITKLALANANMANIIDSNGFVHFLAYADASDGVTASTIYTDYVNLQIVLGLPAEDSAGSNDGTVVGARYNREVPFETYFEEVDNSTRLYLCKNDNNRTEISELHEAKNRHLTMNYGGVGQLKFNIPYRIKKDMNFIPNPNFHRIVGDYLIKYVKGDKTIYFRISNPENVVGDGGKEERVVLCHELHYEWKDKLVRLYSGTKKLFDILGSDGVLNETLEAKTEWQVDYVDSSILTKYRTFDESQVNLLEFVFSSSSKYGDVIPVVNTIDRTVSFYLDENIAYDEGLEISYGKYLKSLTQNDNFDNVVTRLYVYGKDNISINSINPAGTDYIESFDFFMQGYEEDELGNVISSSSYLSDGLCSAILDYNSLLETKRTDFTDLLSQKSGYQDTLLTKQGELDTLQTELMVLNDTKNSLISSGSDLTTINSQISVKQSQISTKESEINSVNASISSVDSQISTLRTEISIQNNFTSDQIMERNRFIKESVWQDENYTTAEDLYDEALLRIVKINQPIVEYQVNSIDFVNALNTPEDWNKLKLGAVVTINYPNYNISIKAKIISFEHDIDGNSINMTIANVKDIKSGILKIMNLLNKATNTSSYIDINKYKINNGESAKTDIENLLSTTWDANKRAIESGSDVQTIVDRNGVTVKSDSDANKFLRMINSVLAFTNDGGNTFKNAITSSGVNAEVVVGQLGVFATVLTDNISAGSTLLGDNLLASSSAWNTAATQAGNSVQLGTSYNNVTITSGSGVVATRTDVKSRSIMSGSGFAVQKNTGTTGSPIWVNKFYADSNGDLIADSITATNINITSGQMSIGSNFSVSSTGIATMSGANISGNITMTGGSISWGSVSKPTYTANEVGALSTSSPRLTFIDATGVYTGTVVANNIIGGDFTAFNSMTIGVASSPSTKTLTFHEDGSIGTAADSKITSTMNGSFSDLTIASASIKLISYLGSVNLNDAIIIPNTNQIWMTNKTIDFSGSTINGLNVTAKFA